MRRKKKRNKTKRMRSTNAKDANGLLGKRNVSLHAFFLVVYDMKDGGRCVM